MATGFFDGVVDTWIKAKEFQQNRAKDAADKIYREQERQFKLQQAQAEAKQQDERNRLEAIRVKTESDYAAVAKQRADETERNNKARQASSDQKEQDKLLVELGKLDLTNSKVATDTREKVYALERKAGYDEQTAGLLADQHMVNLRQSSIQKTPLFAQLAGAMGQQGGQPQQLGAPGQQPQPQNAGNPFMQILQQRGYHGFNGPSEVPPQMTQLSPKEMQEADKRLADIAKSRAQTEAITLANEAFSTKTDALKALTESRKAGTLKTKAETKVLLDKEPLELVKLTAQITDIKVGTTLKQAQRDKDEAETELIKAQKLGKAITPAQQAAAFNAAGTAIGRVEKLDEKINALNATIAAIEPLANVPNAHYTPKQKQDALLAVPVKSKFKSEAEAERQLFLSNAPDRYKELVTQLSALVDQRTKMNAAAQELNKIAFGTKENPGPRQETHRDGSPNKKATDANIDAVHKDAAKATKAVGKLESRFGKMPKGLDPRGQHIESLKPGTDAMRHEQPKKPLGKKKPIGQRSTQDLLKELAK